MHADTVRLYDLALALGGSDLPEGAAVERLLREAAGHDEGLLAALMQANRMLRWSDDPARARAACLLRVAEQRAQHLPLPPDPPMVLSRRVGVAWRAQRGDHFGDDLLVDLNRLRDVIAPPPPARRRALARR